MTPVVPSMDVYGRFHAEAREHAMGAFFAGMPAVRRRNAAPRGRALKSAVAPTGPLDGDAGRAV